jgi:hypothetical protein
MERGLRITNWLWTVGVIVTVVAVIGLASDRIGGRDRVHAEQALFTAWTLGPPCWFILQNRLWPPAPDGYERFRLHQALLKAVWAGAVAFIAAIMFGRWG